MLDFKIVETIPFAKRGHMGPREECVREECYEANGSIHIKSTDSRIKQVHADDQGAGNERVP
jgi:hypothetical protein